MAWRLQPGGHDRIDSLITVACHEDLTATDLVGRYLLSGDETVWMDGPLTRAVRCGAYLLPRRGRRGPQGHHRGDPLAHRPSPDAADREDGGAPRGAPRLPARHLLQPRLPERAEGPEAVDPPALRQPRVRLPGVDIEARSSRTRAASTPSSPGGWPRIGEKVRNLREHGFEEGVSTRLLVYAAQLAVQRHRATTGLRRGHRAGGHRRRRRAAGGRRRSSTSLLP